MDIKDKIKLIKYHRLKPVERYCYDIFTNLEEYVHKDYPTFTFYKKDDILLFDYNSKNGYFWCDYNKFWNILLSVYKLNEIEIKVLVKSMVEEHIIKKELKIIPNNRLLNKSDIENLKQNNINGGLICSPVDLVKTGDGWSPIKNNPNLKEGDLNKITSIRKGESKIKGKEEDLITVGVDFMENVWNKDSLVKTEVIVTPQNLYDDTTLYYKKEIEVEIDMNIDIGIVEDKENIVRKEIKPEIKRFSQKKLILPNLVKKSDT